VPGGEADGFEMGMVTGLGSRRSDAVEHVRGVSGVELMRRLAEDRKSVSVFPGRDVKLLKVGV
jgi:hypothetical protein